jgi:outer membrane protein
MRKYILIFTLIIITGFRNTSGQPQLWSLEDCINYAIANNIQLKRQKLETETSEVNLLYSRMNVLPTLNLGSDVQIGFGRSIDPTSNLITFSQNLLNSFYVSSNLQLFNGFTRLNTIAANKFMLKAGLENEKINRNALIIDILSQYYQVLYSKGIENASKMQLELSEKQLFRITRMVETGKEALSKQYEMESRASSDKLDFTIAHNSASQAITTLKQTLQIEPGSEFDIMIPDLNNIIITDRNYKTDSIYSIAAQTLPRLKAIEFELMASQKKIAAAIGNVSPKVSIGGSVSTGYYNALNDTSNKISYSRQLKNNTGEQVYLSVSVPIFNNYSTGKDIKLAKIKKRDTELKLELEKNALYSDIENACLNFNRGKDEFTSASANLEFNRKSFNTIEKKFEAGLVDVTDYSASKTTLFKAETDELRTKLQLMIRKITLSFYTTGEFENALKENNGFN